MKRITLYIISAGTSILLSFCLAVLAYYAPEYSFIEAWAAVLSMIFSIAFGFSVGAILIILEERTK